MTVAGRRTRAARAPRNALYAQSGGATAVFNATACGVIEAARAARGRIGRLYAARDGILGALHEDLIDTSREPGALIRALRSTPGAAFGSCRYKLKGLEEDHAKYVRLVEVLQAHDIGWFFYNGGNDSADTTLKLSQISARLGYPLVAIGVPKTIDNDLVGTDCCPGFGSAAKYVATSTREAALDVASMASTSTRVFVLEVMGRNAGWLTAACGLAATVPGDAPHVLLFPERLFDEARFLAKVKRTVERVGYCVVVVSEGLRDAQGNFLAEQGSVDAFGHRQLGGVAPLIAHLVQARLGYKQHWAVADYLQRSARHIGSKTDLEQAYALGRAAVGLGLAGRNAVMPVIERISTRPYRWRIGAVDLEVVANRERKLPRSFVSTDGFSITPACRRYLAPLIEGEVPPPYRHGLPWYVRLRNRPVRRRLRTAFRG
ncbi:MAG: 6-phosphofructokinase [Burkholderiales bacterium]|nr:6-phosphofructokinase [Burkholderiales bacterium]